MEAIKQDWVISLYYDVHDSMLINNEDRIEIRNVFLYDKSRKELNEQVNKLKLYKTDPPYDRPTYGDYSKWKLKKIKIYRIEKHLCKIIDC